MKNIFFPSFELERKTQCLTKTLWGFATLISVFTIFLIAFPIYLLLYNILDLVNGFLFNNMVVIIIAIIITIIILTIFKLYMFLDMVLSSYKFENNQIVKGNILHNQSDFEKFKADYLSEGYIETSNLLYRGMTLLSLRYLSLFSTLQIRGISKIITGILLNINGDFVNKYFDTDVYKKKCYDNPRLIKETKKVFIYMCDNNKVVRIPKIYDGMGVKINSPDGPSILARVIFMSVIIFLAFVLFAVGDLTVNYNNNSQYISDIANIYSELETNLSYYGYSSNKINETCWEFRKNVLNDRISTLKYQFDKKGDIKNVDIEILFNATTNINMELEFIIRSAYSDLSDYEVDEFIADVNSCVNSNCAQIKLNLRDDIFVLGTSNGLRHLHN